MPGLQPALLRLACPGTKGPQRHQASSTQTSRPHIRPPLAALQTANPGARLVALRKDGTTFPVEISLSPVATGTGSFTLTVIRDVTEARRLADLVRAAVTAKHARLGQELLDSITSLCNVGLSLQAASDLPRDVAGQAIAEAFGQLDDTIREIGNNAFAACSQETHPAPRNDAG
jgi:hypothetical protein